MYGEVNLPHDEIKPRLYAIGVLVIGEGTPVVDEWGYNAIDFPVWTATDERATARLYYGPGRGSFESYWARLDPEKGVVVIDPQEGIQSVGVGTVIAIHCTKLQGADGQDGVADKDFTAAGGRPALEGEIIPSTMNQLIGTMNFRIE